MIPLSPAEPQTGQEPTGPTLKKGLFERVARYQQVGVLLVGFAYALGYASRALHAHENNLGALPGVRFEYLVAGTLLLIPPIALCLSLWGIWRLAKCLAGWAAKGPKWDTGVIKQQTSFTKRQAGVGWALIGGFLLGMVTACFAPEPVESVGIVVFVICIVFGLLFLSAGADGSRSTSGAETERANVRRWQKMGEAALHVGGALVALLIVLPVVMAFALALLYGAIAVRHVPQEFGGVKPKCAVLDLSPEQLSSELRSLLANPDENLDSKVVRSRPLEVFSTSEPWLIRLPSPGGRGPQRSIRLDGKAVLSVEWCR
jgi:hypothetical protein